MRHKSPQEESKIANCNFQFTYYFLYCYIHNYLIFISQMYNQLQICHTTLYGCSNRKVRIVTIGIIVFREFGDATMPIIWIQQCCWYVLLMIQHNAIHSNCAKQAIRCKANYSSYPGAQTHYVTTRHMLQ